MEIERKFLISKFPDLPICEQFNVFQFYIATSPVEVRVRSQEKDGDIRYILTFKSEGELSRRELEINITEQIFNKLLLFVDKPAIHKIFKTYKLDGDLLLECSLVDYNTDTEFMYAEIEFKTEELANQFDKNSLPFLLDEVTYDDYYKMKNYWNRRKNIIINDGRVVDYEVHQLKNSNIKL